MYQQMDIPIHIQGGDSTLVRFEGCGLDSPALVSKALLNGRTPEPRVRRLRFPGQVRAVIVLYIHVLI